MATRLRPFMGQLGTTRLDDDPGLAQRGRLRLVPRRRAAPVRLTPAELTEHNTDGHMDIDAVRAGAILVCPVKVDGGGVYLGDMHALQGDGEIAGHTCDVSGAVTLEVEVVKGLAIDGPVLFPVAEDLPYLARPLTEEEHARALARAAGGVRSSRRGCRSRSSERAPTSTARPTTASAVRPGCST